MSSPHPQTPREADAETEGEAEAEASAGRVHGGNNCSLRQHRTKSMLHKMHKRIMKTLLGKCIFAHFSLILGVQGPPGGLREQACKKGRKRYHFGMSRTSVLGNLFSTMLAPKSDLCVFFFVFFPGKGAGLGFSLCFVAPWA